MLKNLLLIGYLTSLTQISHAQISGCTDPAALNFSSSATQNDGSCLYTVTSNSPYSSVILNDTLAESSGLIFFNNTLITHSDDTDIRLFGLDSVSGVIVHRDSIFNISNIDIEDIAQDSTYIYLGDFGNNLNGNRTDLRIYRIRKDSLLAGHAAADTINFSYSDQTNFNPQGANNTDFDCEAFLVTNDSIFLFTKQWLTYGCTIYSLPKTTGNHIAQRRSSYNVQGLVTGATYLPGRNLVALIGYSALLQPWVMLLYDYQNDLFFSGNKRKINIAIGFSQTEAITTTDGARFYVTNERRTIATTVIPQQLHILDLRPYTDPFLHTDITSVTASDSAFAVFPNPAETEITIQTTRAVDFILYNAQGEMMKSLSTSKENTTISIAEFPAGMYFLVSTNENIPPVRFVKL